jgi:hypothetical protein
MLWPKATQATLVNENKSKSGLKTKEFLRALQAKGNTSYTVEP